MDPCCKNICQAKAFVYAALAGLPPFDTPPATPVAAFTAHAFSGYREQCLEAGMNDYISKPVTAPAFDALLGRWLAPGGSTSVVK